MFLLDTNVVSELRKKGRTDPAVLKWAASLPAPTLYLSVITILEIEIGLLQILGRDEQQHRLLRNWVDRQVMPSFAGRILSVDIAVAQRCADLHVPNRRSDRDALIAATALVHGLTVATRNERDFHSTGVACVNPWVS